GIFVQPESQRISKRAAAFTSSSPPKPKYPQPIQTAPAHDRSRIDSHRSVRWRLLFVGGIGGTGESLLGADFLLRDYARLHLYDDLAQTGSSDSGNDNRNGVGLGNTVAAAKSLAAGGSDHFAELYYRVSGGAQLWFGGHFYYPDDLVTGTRGVYLGSHRSAYSVAPAGYHPGQHCRFCRWLGIAPVPRFRLG